MTELFSPPRNFENIGRITIIVYRFAFSEVHSDLGRVYIQDIKDVGVI